MEKDEDIFKECSLVMLDGFPLPKFGPIEGIVRSIAAMTPKQGDIILSTYPKCGTTWSQFIIWGILNDGAKPPSASALMHKHFPFLEITGLRALDDLPSPRPIKLHLPYRLTPKSSDALYVSIIRNVFDCCVSYYHHICQMEVQMSGKKVYPFDLYFDSFVKGMIPFGDYFDHVQSWYERRNDPNVLFLTYEDMKMNSPGSVLKIAQFMGFGDKLEKNPEILADVLKHSSFEYMKENTPVRMPKVFDHHHQHHMERDMSEEAMNEHLKSMGDDEKMKDDNLYRTVNFFRKGKVGTGKLELSEEQYQILNRLIDEKIKYPELRELARRTNVSKLT